jgi:hypothetical protein
MRGASQKLMRALHQIPTAGTTVGTGNRFFDKHKRRCKALDDFTTGESRRPAGGFRVTRVSIKGVEMIIAAWREVSDNAFDIKWTHGERQAVQAADIEDIGCV